LFVVRSIYNTFPKYLCFKEIDIFDIDVEKRTYTDSKENQGGGQFNAADNVVEIKYKIAMVKARVNNKVLYISTAWCLNYLRWERNHSLVNMSVIVTHIPNILNSSSPTNIYVQNLSFFVTKI
jgi:hypothetical protein